MGRRRSAIAAAAASMLLLGGVLATTEGGPAGSAPEPSVVAPVGSNATPAASGSRAPGPLRAAVAGARLAERAEVRWALHAGIARLGFSTEPGRRDRGPRSRIHAALARESGLFQLDAAPLAIGERVHVPYALAKDGVPVFNRRGRLHEGGEASGDPAFTGWNALPRLAPATWRWTRGDALEAARAATGTTHERRAPRVRRGWMALEDRTVPAWRVEVSSQEPLGAFEVTIDARDGRVLALTNRMRSLEGTGLVHLPNPVDAPLPSEVVLTELDGSGNLSGEITRVVDLNAPAAFRPALDFGFPVGDPRLVQTSVYHNLTRTAAIARAGGFPAFPMPVVAYTNLRTSGGDPVSNAFYDPFTPAFLFGDGDGVVLANLGTDSDVAAHEMGHHLFETLVRPEIASGSDPVLAISEGIADTAAALLNGDPRVGEATVPGSSELRRLDLPWRFPDQIDADPHVTGLVFGATNWDLIQQLGAPRFGQALWRGLPFLPPDADYVDYPAAFLAGLREVVPNRRNRRSRRIHKSARRAFAGRGFDVVADPANFVQELYVGDSVTTGIRDRGLHFYPLYVPPNATQVTITTTGTGDVDLVVIGPFSNPSNPSTYLVSQGFGSSERVTVTRFTNPSVEDTVLGIGIFDFPNRRASQYTIETDARLGPGDLAIGDPPVAAVIESPEEIEVLSFTGTAGEFVRLDVEADDPQLDLIAGIFDGLRFEPIAVDDDDGPGRNPLLQGTALPETGSYFVAVASLYDDFDPGVQTGAFTLTLSSCVNTGTDSDSDGVADVCDDDDDDDGFDDPQDDDPFDPLLCADVDDDGCNDCSQGAFDVFDDGEDADGDGQCDASDLDDDNDGCSDDMDDEPFTPSRDDDFDFLGAACDNCPRQRNPGQEDADGDGLGDACAACNPVAWTAPAVDPPDQHPKDVETLFVWPLWPGNQGVVTRGAFNPAGGGAVDPSSSGVHVLLEAGGDTVLDLNLPPGAPGSSVCGAEDGWTATTTAEGPVFEYLNRSGALPPGCAPGPAAGVARLTIEDRRATADAAVRYELEAAGLELATPPDVSAFRFVLALAPRPAPGIASAAALAGRCAETVEPLGSGGWSCRAIKRKKRQPRVRRIRLVDCGVD